MAFDRQKLTELVRSLGESRIFEIVEAFYRRMHQDAMVGFFFDAALAQKQGDPSENLRHIARQQALFILKVAGVSQAFQGHPPHSAHLRLPPILSGHFDRRLVLLGEVLREQKLKPEQVETWVSFEESFREMVVSN